jgi:hypothetical protein
MDAIDLKSMPSDALWKLHEAVTAHLGNKLGVEKAKLAERERRLGKLLESLDTSGNDSHTRLSPLPLAAMLP